VWIFRRERDTDPERTHWYVRSVSISPDGRYAISGSDDNTIKVWDIQKGEEIRTLKGHTGSVFSVSISPDGRYAISGLG